MFLPFLLRETTFLTSFLLYCMLSEKETQSTLTELSPIKTYLLTLIKLVLLLSQNVQYIYNGANVQFALCLRPQTDI